ncbi:hypothetical protein J7E87_07420 [Streptomyces sp. ISL-1]|uniref:hypothetical protein n=1 Tax=Streptomyces sp. ISL-1 TaxID=2817657 RepID=UPI001BE9F1DA|nr:hypothetical protein [Streptomyces sp. ISL-1]MBT2389258.1 hypothetical protein [Streptomyces sp. ISL-1]
MTRTRATDLNTGLDDFLAWAEKERGAPLPVRVADAVLTLLALRGADRRAGVPEPTPQLLRRVLHEDLPPLLCATPAELAAVPGVLTALADRVRAAGRLNAKRHMRLVAAIDDAVPEFRRAIADPRNLTWPAWYASLLRAAGVDPDDPAAVREWLAAHERAPRADRPVLPAPLHRSDVAARTFATRVQLTDALLAAFAHDVEGPSPTGPLLPSPPLDADRPEEALGEELERIAGALIDRWTAAGLSDALAGPYAALAPAPDALPHVALADRLLDEHLDYYGDSGTPLPPPPVLPAPEDIRGLLQGAPLPAALAAGSDDGRELAERCGFPGPADDVWARGTPQELTELGADILAAVVERIAAAPGEDEESAREAHEDAGDAREARDAHEAAEDAEDYALDAAHLLYSLYERGGTADSVARKAAEQGSWQVDPSLEDAPVPVPDTAPADYVTPSPDELSALLGLPGLGEEDRAELDGPARSLSAVVDQLAETGCVFRAGDSYGLTALGNAVLRHVLAAGQVAAPDEETVAAWDAAEVITAVQNWPPRTAARTLAQWTAGHGGGSWSDLLNALDIAKRTDFPGIRTSTLFAYLDLAAVPAEALRSAVPNPTIGAYAHRLLLTRGEAAPSDAERVPPSARAVLILEELDARWVEDLRTYARVLTEEEEPDLAALPSAIPGAFDAAASTWPGGAASLVPALAEAHPPTSVRVLEQLGSGHPDSRVAALASRTAKAAKAKSAGAGGA